MGQCFCCRLDDFHGGQGRRASKQQSSLAHFLALFMRNLSPRNDEPTMTSVTKPIGDVFPSESSSIAKDDAKDIFERDGFCCQRGLLPIDLLSEWQEFADGFFPYTFARLHAMGHTPFDAHCRRRRRDDPDNIDGFERTEHALKLGVKNGFREIVMRSPGRYELSLVHLIYSSNDKTTFPERPVCPSLDALLEQLSPVVCKLLDVDDLNKELVRSNVSLVISTAGSPEQSWHADGGHVNLQRHLPCHCMNVFVPLQAVTSEMGPTEFRPGSHVYTRNLVPMLLAAKAKKRLRPTTAPCLELGDVLFFDYRVLHRGRANQSSSGQRRAFLVITLARPWFKDVLNFPKRSYEDPPTTTNDGS